jgi:hypothetical protein
MARAVRRALAAAGIAALALTATVPTSSASVAPSFAGATVASVQPTNGQVVGVAHPIIVTFTGPVPDRAAAERSINVISPANVTGRFEWLDEASVQFVPDHYWPGHSEITMMAGGIPRTFGTGATVLGVASISAHTFTVSIDGQVVRQMPASMGKPKHQRAGEAVLGGDGLAHHRHSAQRPGGLQADCVRRRPDHLGRGVRALGAVVGGVTGLLQRQPRLHQPQSGQRVLVFQPGQYW